MTDERLAQLAERWEGSRARLASTLNAMNESPSGPLPKEIMEFCGIWHPEPEMMELIQALRKAKTENATLQSELAERDEIIDNIPIQPY